MLNAAQFMKEKITGNQPTAPHLGLIEPQDGMPFGHHDLGYGAINVNPETCPYLERAG